jgi:hypothetical protein
MAVAIPPTGWNYQYPNADGSYTRITAATLDDLYVRVAEYQLGPANCTTLACIIAYDEQINALLPTIIPAVNAYLATEKAAVEACASQNQGCCSY